MSRPRSIYAYLCDLVSIFSLIFNGIYHITWLKQTHLFFVHLLDYPLLFLDDKVDGESEGCCLAFA